MVKTKDFKATILVAGARAIEYANEDTIYQPGSSTHKRYIEAAAGKEFTVDVRVRSRYEFGENALAVDLHVDGKFLIGTVMTQSRFKENLATGSFAKCVMTSVTGMTDEGYLSYPFTFADILTDESLPKSAEAESKYARLGTICLQITEYRLDEEEPFVPLTHKVQKPSIGVISEKDIKGRALNLSTSLGKPSPIEDASVYNGCRIGDALVKFEFRYRSRKALQALLVIPTSPAPEALEDRPVESLTIEEARELLRRQRSAGARPIKKEDTTTQRRHKRMPSSTSAALPVRSHKVSRKSESARSQHATEDSSSNDEVEAISSRPVGASRSQGEIETIDLSDYDLIPTPPYCRRGIIGCLVLAPFERGRAIMLCAGPTSQA